MYYVFSLGEFESGILHLCHYKEKKNISMTSATTLRPLYINTSRSGHCKSSSHICDIWQQRCHACNYKENQHITNNTPLAIKKGLLLFQPLIQVGRSYIIKGLVKHIVKKKKRWRKLGRAPHEVFLKKCVPHQLNSGWEIFQNLQLPGKIKGRSHKKNNQIIVHKIWNTTLFMWKSVLIQQLNDKFST